MWGRCIWWRAALSHRRHQLMHGSLLPCNGLRCMLLLLALSLCAIFGSAFNTHSRSVCCRGWIFDGDNAHGLLQSLQWLHKTTRNTVGTVVVAAAAAVL